MPVPEPPSRPAIRRALVVGAILGLVHISWSSGAVARTCWVPPVDAPVVDPFRPPACPWCPGNRGLEYDTSPGTPVHAVAAGRVTFAGSVAGTRYVVVSDPTGRRVTYGGLRSSAWSTGSIVVSGALVGVTAGSLHLGVRDGDDYVDPAPLIGELTHRIRLVPTDGSDPRPSPPVLRCGSPRTVTRAGRSPDLPG